MRTTARVLVALGLVVSIAATGCGSSSKTASTTTAKGGAAAGAGGKIGVILPDSKSSVRWETADRKYLDAAIKAAGFEPVIQNAEGDKQKMATIADAMISQKVKVLMIVNLDSDSGATILGKAKAAGIKTIDYDRLTLGGGADVYISFDNVKVGTLQGEGLVKCITDAKVTNPKIAVLNGSPD